MREDRERRSPKKGFVWGLSFLALVIGGALGSQLLDSDSPLRTRVLGATAKKPDTTGPSVTVAFPAGNGAYRTATWAGAISGSASDATGVAFVEVRLGTGPWVRATGTTNWSLPMSMPADGTYAVSVRATDTATPVANTSSVSVTFRVDTVRPPAPVLTDTPEDPTFETKAQFKFGDGESGVTFECTLDGAAKACDPQGLEYKNLDAGTHTFRVVAIDAAGNRSDPSALFTWTVLLKKSFGIQGDAAGTLYPGTPPTPLNLTIRNPFNFSIRVVTIDVNAAPAGACGTNNVVVHNLAAGSSPAIVVPANGQVRLSDQLNDPLWQQHWPAAWPTIAMANDGNQDVCKNATFTLSYTGTATKS